jgi:hypothetical protein
LRQPHGVPAFGAREDSDFSTTMEWIGLGGWHDARLRSRGSAKLSVTGNCRQGTVIGPACSPGSGAAGQYCSLFKIVRRTITRGVIRGRRPIGRSVTARDFRNLLDHIWPSRHWSVLNTLREFRTNPLEKTPSRSSDAHKPVKPPNFCRRL